MPCGAEKASTVSEAPGSTGIRETKPVGNVATAADESCSDWPVRATSCICSRHRQPGQAFLSAFFAPHDLVWSALVEQQVWIAVRVPGDTDCAFLAQQERPDFCALAFDLQQHGSHDAGAAVSPSSEIHTKIASERLNMATRLGE
jgi:hypothetical protein